MLVAMLNYISNLYLSYWIYRYLNLSLYMLYRVPKISETHTFANNLGTFNIMLKLR